LSESLLSDYDFVRVNKSHLFNIQHIKQYKKGKGGYLIMTDGASVDVSPTRKEELMGRFGG
jgi:two-component system LytT family response regulator